MSSILSSGSSRGARFQNGNLTGFPTQDEERRTEASERMVLEHHHYPMEEALSIGGTQDFT